MAAMAPANQLAQAARADRAALDPINPTNQLARLHTSPTTTPVVDRPAQVEAPRRTTTQTANANPRTRAQLDQPDPQEKKDQKVCPDFPESPAKTVNRLKMCTTHHSRDASTAHLAHKDHPVRPADQEFEVNEDPRDSQDSQDVMDSPAHPETKDHPAILEMMARPALPETKVPMPRDQLAARDREDHLVRLDPKDQSVKQARTLQKELPETKDHPDHPDSKVHPDKTEMRDQRAVSAKQAKMPNIAHAPRETVKAELELEPVAQAALMAQVELAKVVPAKEALAHTVVDASKRILIGIVYMCLQFNCKIKIA